MRVEKVFPMLYVLVFKVLHVSQQLEETKLKEYLLMNSSKLIAWKDFKAEVNTIKRTQTNFGPLPMDLDAFPKGKAKGAKNAWEKGKGKGGKDTKGKLRQERSLLLVWFARPHAEAVPEGKRKRRKRKRQRHEGQSAMPQVSGLRPLRGKLPSQSLNSFGEGSEQQQQGDDTWWWWSATDEQQ
eukprot:6231604-Amphidinium_carterae.1